MARKNRQDIQQVCKNGHQITDHYKTSPLSRKDFCPTCGEETIFECPNCNNFIKGRYNDPDVSQYASTEVPANCEHCGFEFPWTTKKREAVSLLNEGTNEHLMGLFYVEKICERFHLIVKQMRNRHANRHTINVADEYDVQDLIHSLLRVHFDDIRNEEWTPSYAGSGSRVDFLLKNEKIILEIKKTRETLKDKQIGEQLIVDIARYKAHPDCKTLICFVYDPDGWITNPKSLENDLKKEEKNFSVKVIIVPKGY